MALLLEWGEEINFSCVCVVETALLLLLLLLLIFFLISEEMLYILYIIITVQCCCGDVSKLPGYCNFFGLFLVQ